MDRLKMQSKDQANFNYNKLVELFPNAVTETVDENGEIVRAIDKDILMQEISTQVVEGREERYQFTWPDKRKALLAANAPTTCTLRPCREESLNFDDTENLYIEGDNLEVLKLLQENYLGKIKMIYIDPPYNTGNDFVYEDDFAENSSEFLSYSGQYDSNGNRLVQNTDSNGRFHTDWLNMMYSRLKVARNLLTKDGVIFISIDDNEMINLKKICDEIFGEKCRVENVIWKNKYGAGAYTVGFISVHEYILCYSKNPISDITSELDEEGQSVYNKRDEKFATRGGYMTQPLMTNSLGDRPNLMYPIEYEGNIIYPRKQWVWAKERLQKAIDNNEVEFNRLKDGSYSVRSKAYLKDENGKIRRGKPLSLMNGPFNQDGTKDIRELFGGKNIFDFTKPSALIEKFLSLQINGNDDDDFIVLDFFSGSATTAQAVMNLNRKDGGKRKFIMVQLPEPTGEKTEAFKAGFKNICEIGKERIRRAGARIEKELTNNHSSLFNEGHTIIDTGFRVLKLDSSNLQEVWYRPEEYIAKNLFEATIDNVKPDRNGEDLLFQCMLELDCPLSSKIETFIVDNKKVYNVSDGYILACFEENINNEVISEIAKLQPLYFVMRDSSMANDSVAVNFEQIFKSYSPETQLKVF